MNFLKTTTLLLLLETVTLFAQLTVGGYLKPPYMINSDTTPGFCVEVMKEVCKRVSIKCDYQLFPNKRLKLKFKDEQILCEPCISEMWRMEESSVSVYSSVYLTTWDVVLMKKEKAIKVNSVEDLHGVTLGCGLGYTYTEGFDEAFRDSSILREDVVSHKANVKKLALNRVDGIIIDRYTAPYYINESGLDPTDFVKVFHFKKKTELRIRLHISQKHLLPAINRALEAMKLDGTMDSFFLKYFSTLK